MPRSWIAVLPAVFALSSCGVEAGGTKVIARFGNGTSTAIVHSLPDLLRSTEANGIELDVQLTAQGVLVVHSGEMGGEEPLRLDSLLQVMDSDAIPGDVLLNCKLSTEQDWWTYLEQYTDALSELCAQPGARERVVVECMDDPFLLLLQRKPNTPRLLLLTTEPTPAIWRALASGYTGVAADLRHWDREAVELAHGLHLEVGITGAGSWWSKRRAGSMKPDILIVAQPEIH
jgi:hypothetical protein